VQLKWVITLLCHLAAQATALAAQTVTAHRLAAGQDQMLDDALMIENADCNVEGRLPPVQPLTANDQVHVRNSLGLDASAARGGHSLLPLHLQFASGRRKRQISLAQASQP
jgi:hypothetical protein